MNNQTYSTTLADSNAAGEKNDCAVKAVAITCGVPYKTAHAALAKRGRRKRCGTYRNQTWGAIKDLGFKLTKITKPAGAKTMKTLAKGMAQAGEPTKGAAYLVHQSRHVAAFVNGKIEDWSANRAKRVVEIYRVEPLVAPAKPKATKPKATKPKATNRPQGVQPGTTRPYLAGQIIAKHGLAAGVTPAMVAELDAEYGNANPRESKFCLRNAWHAIRAFEAAQA